MFLKKHFRMILLLIALLLAGPAIGALAETAADLQTKIEGQSKAISALEQEIANYQSQLSSLGNQKNTLANTIKILNLESQKLGADIRLTEGKISEANLKLDALGTSIQKTGAAIGDLKNAIGKGLREMNAEDNTSIVEVLAREKSISDVWHFAGERTLFRQGLREKTQELGATKTALVASKSQVEKVKGDLVTLEAQLQDQKSINQKTQAQKNALLKSTKNEEATYQKLVAQKLAQKAQLETDLRDYESRLKYVLDPKSLPPAGSSPLSWPLDKVVITQLFGRTVSAARLYTSGSHNGVDFGAPIGTRVMAMASGTVVASGNSDLSCPGASYGNWIFIKYDNGLAGVFGHLSLVKASAGERVYPGEVVAYSGASGYATGPHLHVSVFPNNAVNVSSFPSKACPGRTITIPTAAVNAYLDPMLYFPKH